MEAASPREDGTLWGQPQKLRWALWHGGGDAEGKEREKSDVPLCPEGDNSSPSSQNTPTGTGVGAAEEGTLQMEGLAGCSCLGPVSVPRV